jgi:hypothetical protein
MRIEIELESADRKAIRSIVAHLDGLGFIPDAHLAFLKKESHGYRKPCMIWNEGFGIRLLPCKRGRG